ncbi:MAG: FprA family A-type flavoprotein [Bacteroidaceae bacterium]|nr:FprA family A-type flavoprotein [Bacteroidaceae bacterium]MBQ4056421.1 FprA family A-type flavoprotein [Bacteroidaceae bacterium]
MNFNVTEQIKYIGVDDTTIDLFESQYIVPNGISYNSYLITDDKIAVMDTVDRRKSEDWWGNLETALEGRTPDYLIVQHMEPDHAGNIAVFLQKYPEAKVVASAKAIQMMPQFFEGTDFEGRTIAVKEGETLALGTHTLQFFMAPMVHWPEVMVTYDQADKVLFTADGFGKFGALAHEEDWACEARRYYFNICGKYGAQVQALLKKAATLDIACICPLHGPILKENLGYYIGLYDTWSKYEVETEGVFIAYASIHGGTKLAAEKMAEILREKGAPKVSIADLCRDDMAEAVEDAFRMSKLIVAASSYDADVFPPMHDFLHHLKLKAYQKRRVGIIENGSWAPCAGRVMKGMLETMKEIEIVEPMVTIRSAMKQGDLPAMEALADAILK